MKMPSLFGNAWSAPRPEGPLVNRAFSSTNNNACQSTSKRRTAREGHSLGTLGLVFTCFSAGGRGGGNGKPDYVEPDDI